MTTEQFYALPIRVLVDLSKQDRSFSYSRTLAKGEHGNFESIGDILSSEKSGKCMSDLKDAIEHSRDIIENAYMSGGVPEGSKPVARTPDIHILPKEDLGEDEPFEAFMARFIADYYQVIKQSKNAGTHAMPFRLAYVADSLNSDSMSDMDIHDVMPEEASLSRERIRQLREGWSRQARQMLEGQCVRSLAASEQMQERFRYLLGCTPTQLVNTLSEGEYVIRNRRTHAFVLDVLEVKVSKDKQSMGIAKRNDESLTKTKESLKPLINELKDRVVADIDDIRLFIKRNPKIESTAEELFEVLRNSRDDFEVIRSINDSELVALRWERLGSVAARTARILYDNSIAVNSPDAQLTIDEIKHEYAMRAAQHGIKDGLSALSSIARHKRILPNGNGSYSYNYEQKDAAVQTIEQKVKAFVAANPSCSLRQLEAVFTETNKNSLKDYRSRARRALGIKDHQRRKKDDPQERIKVLAEILSESAAALPLKELTRIYDEKMGSDTPTEPKSIETSLRRADDMFRISDEKTVSLLIGKDQLSSVDFSEYQRAPRKVEYIDVVRCKVVEELQDAPGNTMRATELLDAVTHLLPQGYATTNLYRQIESFDFIGKSKQGKFVYYTLDVEEYERSQSSKAVEALEPELITHRKSYSWGELKESLGKYFSRLPIRTMDDALERMHEIMQRYEYTEFAKTLKLSFKVFNNLSTEYEQEFLFYKLAFGLEQYLKNYFRYFRKTTGLVEVIQMLQDRGYLPERKMDCKVGSPQWHLQKDTGVIISLRNTLAHQNRPSNDIRILFSYYVLVAELDLDK